MKPVKAIAVGSIVLGSGLVLMHTGAAAQAYPVKPIRYIIPFAPAGTGDVCGRFHAQKMQERMGQPVVIDNRAGANQAIGIEAAAKAAPDGYTILQGALSGIVMNTIFANIAGTKLPYDVQRDLTPVSMVCTSPLYLGVHASVGAKTVKELIAIAKARPNEIVFASSGAGSNLHLALELFRDQAGIKITHVPYKGAGPAVTDVIGGQAQGMFADLPVLTPFIKAGRLRAIAVAGVERTQMFPQLPTMKELGYPRFNARQWYGMFAPAGTPREIVTKLNETIRLAVATPDVKDRYAEIGADVFVSSPEEFAVFIKAEIERWHEIVKKYGIVLEP